MDERTQQTLRTVATIGRIALIPAGFFVVLAAFLSDYKFYDLTQYAGVLGGLILIVLGIAGLVRPMRPLDVAAVFVAGTLAGSFFPVGFESIHSVAAILVWLLLVVTAAANGAGLATGAVEVDPRVSEALQSARSSVEEQVQRRQSQPEQPVQQTSEPRPSGPPTMAQRWPEQQQKHWPGQTAIYQAAQAQQRQQTDEERRAAAAAAQHQQQRQQQQQAAAQSSGPEAGWYDQGNGTLRWWDGRAWTDDIRPIG
jgi:hypothetical protein